MVHSTRAEASLSNNIFMGRLGFKGLIFLCTMQGICFFVVNDMYSVKYLIILLV